jgi:hypothetical protein
MAKIEGQYRPARRVRPAVAAVALLGLVVAACGGGGGGGGGDGDELYTMRVSFANETDAEATLALNDANPVTVESCKGGIFTWEMPLEDWIFTINGETAIDSLEYEFNQLDNDVAARLWLHEDGSIELESFQPGSNITAPAAIAICT